VARPPVPAFRPPQLATLADTIPAGDDWLFEVKYDGYRSIAAIAGDTVRLYSRNGHDWSRQFRALLPTLAGLTARSAVLDGEVCALSPDGRTDFATLKLALSSGSALVYYAFDLLEEDGKSLGALPLLERKARLERLLGARAADDPLQFSPHVIGNGQAVLDALCHDGHEGVIAKRAGARYRGGRSRDWLKVKCIRRQEFVIGGWTPSTRRGTFASLLLGTKEDGALVYRGRVGTGFTVAEAEALQRQLDARARKTSPFADVPAGIARAARWVRPTLVGEVAFTEFTADGLLRHPSFIALRDDKPAAAVHREAESLATRGVLAAERHGVRLTSPDRLAFSGQGVTKADLAGYYDAVAPRMLPHVANRPLSLLRCPQGRSNACFFQKHDSGGFPDQMQRIGITEKSGERAEYFYVTDVAGLLAGTQMNVLEWHVWGSRVDDIEHPERLVFDIDPDEALGFDAVRDAAGTIAELLERVGLRSYPLVSGGKGVHVIAPLAGDVAWPEAKAFCKAIALRLATAEPERFVATLSKARRKGRLFIDYLRNERGSTAIAPWSVRARAGAPVAVPVSWPELARITAASQFGLAEAVERAGADDPWRGYANRPPALQRAIEKLAALAG
jgi:bifunctional non-homologous end joining protein LigD